ncbi:MAG: hypothetical protein K0B87_07650 [Candidatus Syntrophosphaera sp.]|nr:hypothetical protein [Candidatus Syntrophosphaera sp.]
MRFPKKASYFSVFWQLYFQAGKMIGRSVLTFWRFNILAWGKGAIGQRKNPARVSRAVYLGDVLV